MNSQPKNPRHTLVIGDVRFTPAHEIDRQAGLLGWISCAIDDLQLDGITLRTTANGRLTLAYPARRDQRGIQHPFMLPITERARASVEEQILAALKRQGWCQ